MHYVEFAEKIIVPLVGGLLAVAIAIGWYRARFVGAVARIKNLETRVGELEHDTGKKLDKLNMTMAKVDTKVDLLIKGRIKEYGKT